MKTIRCILYSKQRVVAIVNIDPKWIQIVRVVALPLTHSIKIAICTDALHHRAFHRGNRIS